MDTEQSDRQRAKIARLTAAIKQLRRTIEELENDSVQTENALQSMHLLYLNETKYAKTLANENARLRAANGHLRQENLMVRREE